MKFDITVNDPLLEPFLPVIRRRHERSVLKELEFTNRKKRLADIFNNHLYFGLHRLPGKGWVFRECSLKRPRWRYFSTNRKIPPTSGSAGFSV